MARTIDEATAYCKKSGDYEEHGEAPVRHGVAGAEAVHGRYRNACEALRDGRTTLGGIARSDPDLYVRHGRGFAELCRELRCGTHRVASKPPFVAYIQGPSGCGKTRIAHELEGSLCLKPENIFTKPSKEWFDMYTGEFVCIIDDIRPNTLSFDFLLRVIDRYAITVEVKGGTVKFVSPVIILTSVVPWEGIAPRHEDATQLDRRLNHKYIMESFDDFEPTLESITRHIVEHCEQYDIDIPRLEEMASADSN